MSRTRILLIVPPENHHKGNNGEHIVYILGDVSKGDLLAVVEPFEEVADDVDEVGDEKKDEQLGIKDVPGSLRPADCVAGRGSRRRSR